ncbi:MAG: ribosome small subunit-dependent GTPase A [bacterium]
MELLRLGFDQWFESKQVESPIQGLKPARVSAVDKDSFLIIGEYGEMQAQIMGRLRFETESNIDYPTVGDWVNVEYYNDYTLAIIYNIFPRKTLLKRKSAGKNIEYQLIGANIDIACIMQSLDENFNIPRLDRYLVAVNEAHIMPVILYSKSDLIPAEECEKKISEVKVHYPNYRIIKFSNISQEGLGEVKSLFLPAKTYCIIGSSGVGKTTLLNKLIGAETFATREVRKSDHKGKHATARRQLIILNNRAIYIDTPGMKELGNISVDFGIKETFPDIVQLSKQCRFADCTHSHEPECAVQKALESGELQSKRLKNYIKLCKEAEYNTRSYVEKRKKDKEFGKFCKSVMNEIKKKRL